MFALCTCRKSSAIVPGCVTTAHHGMKRQYVRCDYWERGASGGTLAKHLFSELACAPGISDGVYERRQHACSHSN